MAITSRQKGKNGELELAHKIANYGYEMRRGQQYCGANGSNKGSKSTVTSLQSRRDGYDKRKPCVTITKHFHTFK